MPTDDATKTRLLRTTHAANLDTDKLLQANAVGGLDRAELLRTTRVFIPVVAGKGGTGKSFTSQLFAGALGTIHSEVQMIDTDYGNSSTRSVAPDAVMVDLRDVAARGALLVQLEALAERPSGAIVMDTGAQEDGLVLAVLGWLAREAGKRGIVVLPALPITLSSHAQAQAVAFAEHAAALSLPTLLVRNLGQGRKLTDYDRWTATNARRVTLERGAVEVDLPDLGARWTDEAAGFGLTLADAAAGRFDKAGLGLDKARAAARTAAASAVFDANVRAWLCIFLAEVGDILLDGLAEAIINRRRLDRGRG